jgi:hypothetical protein
VPANFDDVLGGMTGVSDLQNINYKEALAAAKKEGQDSAEAKKKAAKFSRQIKGLKDTCQKNEKDEKIGKGLKSLAGQFTDKLNRCKALAGRPNATPPDFGSNFESLSDSLAKICQEAGSKGDARDECEKLRSSISNANEDCIINFKIKTSQMLRS